MKHHHFGRLFAGGILLLAFAGAPARAVVEQQPVTVTQDANTASLSNGIVSATIQKSSGNLLTLQYHGLDLLSRGGGYWNIYGSIPGQPPNQNKGTPVQFSVSQDPAKNGGALGEVTLRYPYGRQPTQEPLDIEIRYSLRRGDSGVYGWTIASHEPGYPPFNIIASTVCMKLNPDIFDFLSIDSRRQRHMPTPQDWVAGTQLNLWEARRLNTGIHKGEVEHKYDYNMLFSQTPAWGWSSTTRNVGLYFVNPSIEYVSGSPVSVDYGGHLDVKASLPADPTLLFIWHSPHYGGRQIQINANESWRKIVGPFLLYCDSDKDPAAMWQEALARAAQDKKEWPFAWAQAPGYEHADQRGSASGQLVVQDPQAPKATAAGAWVGLAQPPYEAVLGKTGTATTTIDWQTDGKHYQYWTQADAGGHFTIPNARPGNYVLYAFTGGVLGAFSHPDVHVEAGKTTDLGQMTWTPVRYGRQLWDIGIPDRSAGEFLHGDHYWQWGLYNLYPQEFPNGVDYVIGKSDYHRDWDYAEPPTPDGPNHWKDTTWRIHFNMDKAPAGTATLRLAICGMRGGPVDVSVNGKSIGGTGPLPESGVMHRDGIRSSPLLESDLKFDAALLQPGENVIALTKHVRTWTDGVLYDYLRLELAEKQ